MGLKTSVSTLFFESQNGNFSVLSPPFKQAYYATYTDG